MTNAILSSMRNAGKALVGHKLLVLVVIFLQVIFLSVWFGNQVFFQMRVNVQMEDLFTKLQGQLPTDEKLGKNILSGESIVPADFEETTKMYESIVSNVRMFLIIAGVIFVVLNGLVWGTNRLLLSKGFIKYYAKFIAAGAVFFLILVIAFQASIASTDVFAGDIDKTFTTKSYFFIAIFGLVSYFMPIAFSLLGSKSLKETPKATLILGLRKIHYFIGMYAINIILYAIPMAIMILFTDSIIALTAGAVLMLIAMVYARTFTLALVGQLSGSEG